MGSVLMPNGEIFSHEEISELTNFIINKFAEKKLSIDKAELVLERTKEVLKGYSTINKVEASEL